MLFPAAAVILASAGLIEARGIAHRHADMHIAKRATATSSGDSSLTLSANAIQSGSFVDGSKEIGAAEVGQALSETSTNNFINYCAGKTLTNGLQILTGSCNGIPMGDIPAKTAMVSSIITFPQYGSSSIQSDTTFNITVQMSNIVTGSFTNADATYYAAPQQLSGGKVVGHTHVTVQDMGNSLNPTTPLDPTLFAFFKGINTAADSKGVLTATVTGGLPAGNYRLCTLASSSNHQPVLMPVAQRGTADDCTKFVVSGSGTTANAASNNGSGGQAAAAAAASAVAAGPGAIQSSAASSSSTSKANAKASTSAKASTTAKTSAATKATTTKATTSSAKAAVATTSSSSKATSVTLSSAGSSASATSKGSKSKGSKNVSGSTQVTSITVIEYITFFNFAASKGGVCPSVNKNGETAFEVLGEQFADLASAAAAACGHQFTSCQSFAGPLFSVEECVTQQDSCSSAASLATTTAAAPTTLTASITAAATQTVSISSQSGVSVLSTVTSSTTVSIAAAASTTALAIADSAATGACSIVTGTVTVDAVATVATSSSSSTLSSASSKATGFNFSNSTASATSSSASAKASVSTNSAASSTALGGISAPAITNSGDASRPFLVNGNTFVNEAAALQRSCDIQFNQCANAVNGGTASGFTLSDCSAQQTTCNAA